MSDSAITQITIYWENSPKWNERWVERIRRADGSEIVADSDVPKQMTNEDLQASLVNLAFEHGVEIREDEVTADSKDGGGIADWYAESESEG